MRGGEGPRGSQAEGAGCGCENGLLDKDEARDRAPVPLRPNRPTAPTCRFSSTAPLSLPMMLRLAMEPGVSVLGAGEGLGLGLGLRGAGGRQGASRTNTRAGDRGGVISTGSWA